jgi:CheY-like chemotaxis protein
VRPALRTGVSELDDDREALTLGERCMLIVEDDANFARLLQTRAVDRNFKVLVAQNGNDGLLLARRYRPSAITLDIRLPDMDGWRLLDLLKHDPHTRHIPVHVISVEEQLQRALKQGALAVSTKPINDEGLEAVMVGLEKAMDYKAKRVLIVEDNAAERTGLAELIGQGDVRVTTAAETDEAIAALETQTFDCLVLDLSLPGKSGFEFLQDLEQRGLANIPIIVYTGKDLSRGEEAELRRLAQSVIIKSVKSADRLVEEVSLYLHQPIADLAPEHQGLLEPTRNADGVLADRQVLIVDDDYRNIFALTSLLERAQMRTLFAENGKDALAMLSNTPGIDVVLMDIMMPETDGYETIRAIRAMPGLEGLPIIALTAKAMKGDREKCLEAGASDYIAKPVDTEQLLSLLRVWLY